MGIFATVDLCKLLLLQIVICNWIDLILQSCIIIVWKTVYNSERRSNTGDMEMVTIESLTWFRQMTEGVVSSNTIKAMRVLNKETVMWSGESGKVSNSLKALAAH